MRWKAPELEQAILDDLESMKLASPEVAKWFRTELGAAMDDLTAYRRRQSKSLAKRKSELVAMQDRLLNAYLAGTVGKDAYRAKSNELKAEDAKVDISLQEMEEIDARQTDTALQLFDWTQNAAEIWRGSNNAVRREILDAVCLNRTLSDVSLVTEKRKPFDALAKRPELENSRADRI